jgi:hypothetical protein
MGINALKAAASLMSTTILTRWLTVIVVAVTSARAASSLADDEFELSPIEYSKTEPANEVSELLSRLDRGEQSLQYDKRQGYLPALLEALRIPAESQMLVFSKTSMQRTRISPRTPRALYFNDDLYVGYCQNGDVIELSAADPKLGMVFYTLEQQEAAPPVLTRQTQSCLQCHASTSVDGIPGLLARSVFVGPSGLPILAEGSHRVDHTTPIRDRWGGWYVTGQHGKQPHLGNLVVRDRDALHPVKNDEGHNIVDLSDRIRVDNYLTPHSDIVALMVFEHQVLVHNLLTKANFETRRALHYQADLNRALGEPETNQLESTTRRIQHAGDQLVEGLLFSDEAAIEAPIKGTSAFPDLFAESGPRDSQGRSLRDFDLKTRMFKHPCSYLIYSSAFDALPTEMKTYVAARLRDILTGEVRDEAFDHLSAADRQAILEILTESKPELWSQ